MADIQPPPPTAQTPQREQPPPAFPTELPLRPPQRTKRSGLRDCLSFNFLRSYSLRRTPNARTKCRRIAMIASLIIALGTVILGLMISSSIAALVVFCILDFFFFWALCWSLAVIGDAVGSRRVLGINWTRNVLDIFIYFSLFLYIAFFLIWFFVLYLNRGTYQAFWLALTAANIAVAWIASEPPYQGF